MSQLNWTEAQWNRVNSAITEEFTKASVAGAFLPCYGPLGPSSETVSKQTLLNPSPATIAINDDTTRFWTLQVNVQLSLQQISDEHLSSALYAFLRAATLLARTEDYVVFQGSDGSRSGTKGTATDRKIPADSSRDEKSRLQEVIKTPLPQMEGLLFSPVASRSTTKKPTGAKSDGEALVEMVSAAIGELETSGHPGPFACVLGQYAFREAHRPDGSLALPADRITPMLQGPLLRSGTVRGRFGVVVPQTGESIDLVVASPPKVQFLQVNSEAKYLFRVYERFVLRIKDASAVAILKL